MKIAIISDTHDNIQNLEKLKKLLRKSNCEAFIHCGDFCAPFVPTHLIESEIPGYACFGNNDEDQAGLVEKANGKIEFFSLAREYGEVVLDGKKIAFCHYPKLGALLSKSHEYDAVFHGHTHKSFQSNDEETVLANPGAVCGIISGRNAVASFGIYDTTLHKFSLIEIN